MRGSFALALATTVALSTGGCEECGRAPVLPPKPQATFMTRCRFDSLRVFALFDATAVSFGPARLGIVTPDDVDTDIEAGFAATLQPSDTIAAVSGRLGHLYVVVRGFHASPSSDFDAPTRLVRRRNGTWDAIPSISAGAVYAAPALYRGGALVRVRQLGPAGEGSVVAGIDLPPGVDAASLFPAEVTDLLGLEDDWVIGEATTALYALGPNDTRAKKIVVPDGPRTTTGTTHATFRVHIGNLSYRLGDDRVIFDARDPYVAPDLTEREGRERTFRGHDGELFLASEEPQKTSPWTTLSRERNPKRVRSCEER